MIKKKYISGFFMVSPVIIVLLFAGFLIGSYYSNQGIAIIINDKFITGKLPAPTQILPSPTLISTPTPIEYKISFIDSPKEVTEGGQATFTWTIDGPPKTIHKSVVYFGTVDTDGILTKDIAPAETKYTDSVKDFIAGDYVIPMRFVGNATIAKPGKYYVRVYALIDGDNYWSEERNFTVMPVPGYEIKLVSYPQTVKLNENSAFTWEITGPQATTDFTAIVGAKESKSGKLDETIDLTETPYKVLVKDFTNGASSIPLRFVGNTILPEYGKYYIRALVVVNRKNIWSDEYTLTVQ